jgi:hypothetical protein
MQYGGTFTMDWLTKNRVFAGIGFVALLVISYLSLSLEVQEELLKLIAAIDWPVTVLVLAFFFQRIFTYTFFSLDSYNFFGLSGALRPIEDVIEDQVDRRLREEKEKERKEELLGRYDEIPNEIVDYLNMQEEELSELRGRLSELSNAALLDRAVKGETARRARQGM